MPYSPLEEEEKEDALEDSFVQRWLSELVPDFVTENVFWYLPTSRLSLGSVWLRSSFCCSRDRYLFRLDALRQQQALESEEEDDDDEDEHNPVRQSFPTQCILRTAQNHTRFALCRRVERTGKLTVVARRVRS